MIPSRCGNYKSCYKKPFRSRHKSHPKTRRPDTWAGVFVQDPNFQCQRAKIDVLSARVSISPSRSQSTTANLFIPTPDRTFYIATIFYAREKELVVFFLCDRILGKRTPRSFFFFLFSDLSFTKLSRSQSSVSGKVFFLVDFTWPPRLGTCFLYYRGAITLFLRPNRFSLSQTRRSFTK